ncbi:MAG: rhodanese-like domain-containing protein [Myxococcota bacterium]
MLVLALLACGSESAAQVPASIEPSELAARIASGSAPRILDVRTPGEFAAGHIPGAINVPHDELGDRLSSLDLAPTEEIVVHCERGGRAAAAESILRSAGYTRVRDLDGHMQAWRSQGRPVE